MQLGGLRLSWLRRRLWLVVATTVAVTAIAAVFVQPGSSSYTSESVLLVRSGATTNTPGSANEANRLAITYAELIPQDSQVLERVAQTLQTNRTEIEDNVSVTNDPNTSILRVSYRSSETDEAINGARAIAEALAGPIPASPNFNGLALSRLPDSAQSDSGAGSSLATAGIIGLCLGLALSLIWERIHVRIDRPEDLEGVVGCPVSSLEDLSNDAIDALGQRWQALSSSQPSRVALTSAVEGRQVFVESTTRVFDRVLKASSHNELILLPAGLVGSNEVGEAIVQHADVAVLVVPERTEVSKVRSAVEALADFGAQPQWALFASSKVVKQTVRRDVVEASEASQPGAGVGADS